MPLIQFCLGNAERRTSPHGIDSDTRLQCLSWENLYVFPIIPSGLLAIRHDNIRLLGVRQVMILSPTMSYPRSKERPNDRVIRGPLAKLLAVVPTKTILFLSHESVPHSLAG